MSDPKILYTFDRKLEKGHWNYDWIALNICDDGKTLRKGEMGNPSLHVSQHIHQFPNLDGIHSP